jgi:NDP-sugar pyrophosphorylase family protein
LGEKIRDYFGDGRSWGVRIEYSFEENPLGTGGALKNAKHHLGNRFFLIYGDSFLPIDYLSIEKYFSNADKMLLMMLYDNREDTAVPNNIALNEKGIVTYYEKNSNISALEYVDAGVLAMKKDVLDTFPSNRVISLENDVFPGLIPLQECAGLVTQQRFYDIGTPERLKCFEAYIMERKKHDHYTYTGSN